jgi:hypothetical protein
MHLQPLSAWKLVIAAASRKPRLQQGNHACVAAKLWQHAIVMVSEIAELSTCRRGEIR